tara:strand:+ start:922 stop:1614 length:693 start_codon:yes stop_codon:yes gene_type:complete
MSRNTNILIVEDEKSIREVLKLNLQLDDYDVICCDNGKEAIKVAIENDISLIIMDVMLPEVNGVDAVREIKRKRPELPIIMLSALDQSSDKIKGLKAGADDYMAKPFNYEELLLRINKQLKSHRNNHGEAEEINILNNIINFTSNTISNITGTHKMNQKEAALMKYLYENKNRVLSREELYAHVWNYNTFPNSRTVDNHITSLRKALKGKDIKSLIQTERGIGYKLVLLD